MSQCWPAHTVRALVCPLAAHQFAVPAKQRLGRHEERTPRHPRQDPAGRGQDQPISAAKVRLANMSAKNLKLM
ncbi:MAG: hypothetical protein ACXWC0_30355, partial [Burkholderiales bacterium]